jgi:hypothetical protein
LAQEKTLLAAAKRKTRRPIGEHYSRTVTATENRSVNELKPKIVLRTKKKINLAKRKTLGTRAGALLGTQKKSRLGSIVACETNPLRYKDHTHEKAGTQPRCKTKNDFYIQINKLQPIHRGHRSPSLVWLLE